MCSNEAIVEETGRIFNSSSINKHLSHLDNERINLSLNLG